MPIILLMAADIWLKDHPEKAAMLRGENASLERIFQVIAESAN